MMKRVRKHPQGKSQTGEGRGEQALIQGCGFIRIEMVRLARGVGGSRPLPARGEEA